MPFPVSPFPIPLFPLSPFFSIYPFPRFFLHSLFNSKFDYEGGVTAEESDGILDKAFYGFDPDFFQQNVSRITDDVISQIKGSLDLWPTLVEICFFQRHRAQLPQRRVHNPPAAKPSGSARRVRVPV